ncbi:hypothetical protein MMC21_007718 [Puttea exsequens]|nr:hypothetical protein [Puttea exsequens]
MSLESLKSVKVTPWYDAYPAPSTRTPPTISRQELLAWMNQEKVAGKDFVVVDVRKLDHTGGFIHGSLNLPIESLYPTLPTLHALFRSAGVKTVIWYCVPVTSRGRGNRAAAWFGDYLKEQHDSNIESVALYEGMLGWALAGSEYTQHIDEYLSEAWSATDATKHTGNLN